MQVKVFSATKLHEALALVRQKFGPEAVIMDRLEGIDRDGNRIWHVHAALDDNDEKVVEKKTPATRSKKTKHAVEESDDHIKASMARLEKIVEGLGRQESDQLRQALITAESRQAFDHLMQIGVAPIHAFDMADDFVQRSPISAAVLHWSERLAPQNENATLLLAGPSGAGKTTLVAKLATHYSLKGLRVGLISTDTNRMGGTDMLNAYSEILGAPFATVRCKEDIPKALEKTKSAQLLLVDTEGWNTRRSGGVRKQRVLWDEIPSAHRVLVMPANMDEMDGMEMLAKADALGVNQLAFTKLDETSRPGKIVNWAAASQIDLSYCSFGPDVPDQMGWLTPHALTALLGSQETEYAKETA